MQFQPLLIKIELRPQLASSGLLERMSSVITTLKPEDLILTMTAMNNLAASGMLVCILINKS